MAATLQSSNPLTPVVLLNGWGPRGHEGPYELGIDQNMNGWGLNAGATLPYLNADDVVSGRGSGATAIGQHTHQYYGCVWGFPAARGIVSDGSFVIAVLSKVGLPNIITTFRSAGIWVSLDGGLGWTALYNSGARDWNIDSFPIPAGVDVSNVQVMAFTDSHDDMSQVVRRIFAGPGEDECCWNWFCGDYFEQVVSTPGIQGISAVPIFFSNPVLDGFYWNVRGLSVAMVAGGGSPFRLYLMSPDAAWPPKITAGGGGNPIFSESNRVCIAPSNIPGGSVGDFISLTARANLLTGGISDVCVLFQKGRLLIPSKCFIAAIPPIVVGGTATGAMTFSYQQIPNGCSPPVTEIP